MREHRMMVYVYSASFITLSFFSGAASSAISLVGDQVGGTLTAGTFNVLLSPFTASPVTVGPGPEFSGELSATAWSDTDLNYNVIVDLSDNYFTVEIQATNTWFPISAIGSTSPLFVLGLNDLNGGEDITSVVYNDNLTVGFTGGIDPTSFLNLTSTSVEMGFASIRAGNIYHFDINPVPVPAAVWLFGSGLIGLIGVARKKVCV